MGNSIEKGIVRYVERMPEKEAKHILATLLLNYNKIGRKHSREEGFEVYGNIYRSVVIERVIKVNMITSKMKKNNLTIKK